jgi:hypothetical protein
MALGGRCRRSNAAKRLPITAAKKNAAQGMCPLRFVARYSPLVHMESLLAAWDGDAVELPQRRSHCSAELGGIKRKAEMNAVLLESGTYCNIARFSQAPRAGASCTGTKK